MKEDRSYRRWSKEEDEVLIEALKKSPFNKKRAFKATAEELGRTVDGCRLRWYTILSNPKHPKYGGIIFLTVSDAGALSNRSTLKKAKDITIWAKCQGVVAFLKRVLKCIS